MGLFAQDLLARDIHSLVNYLGCHCEHLKGAWQSQSLVLVLFNQKYIDKGKEAVLALDIIPGREAGKGK